MLLRSLLLSMVLVSPAIAEVRPTRADIEKSIAASKQRFLADNPPVSKESVIAKLGKDLEIAKNKLENALKNKGRKEIKEARTEYDEIADALKDAQKNFKAEIPEARIADMDWNNLPVGAVGKITESIRVMQIHDANSFLGRCETSRTVHRPRRSGLTVVVEEVKRPQVMFAGQATDGLIEDRLRPSDYYGVVTGTYSFKAASGAMRTVRIIEPFDPDRLDEWK